jgi:energy-coupling factor transporter transmembrane protein EcfT
MTRLSHGLLGALNLVTLLLSLPVLCAGVYIVTRATTPCERGLQIPVVAFGCGLLLLSLVGLAGACGRRGAARPFLWVYVAFMFLLAVLVFAFAVFAFVVTHRGAGGAVSGSGYREYRLGDYSGWLQARIAEPETWRRVESCLSEARVCGGREFYRQHLSPIQVYIYILYIYQLIVIVVSYSRRPETTLDVYVMSFTRVCVQRCSPVAASRRRGAGSGT